MGGQAPTILQIKTTQKYNDFKILGANRKIDSNHVSRLKREMEYNPELLQAAPVLVNENMYIIDGQHRFVAAKELGLPISYIMKPGLTIEAARHMNITQKRWTIMDFADSWAEAGYQDYVMFRRTIHQFPRIAPAIVMKYLQGVEKRDTSEDFRRGHFVIGDYDQAIENLKQLDEVIHVTGTRMNIPMAMALHSLFVDDNEFIFEKFMNKLDGDKGAQEIFVPAASRRNCLRSIEDVYNFRSPSRVRLY